MDWVVLIPLLPALVFALMTPITRKLRNRLIWLSVSTMAVSAGLSIAALTKVLQSGSTGEAIWTASWSFFTIGGQDVRLSMALTPLAAIMLTTVTIVAVCVQVYSLGYMRDEQRRGWYFAVLSLFTSAMLVLVLANDLLLIFGGWELMGLCSYLLIGFWYELEASRQASQKAFMVTRLGDLGFFVALFAIYAELGSFDLNVVLSTVPGWAPGVATVVAAGIFWAAMGKSAQVPLHVWLPDAMAGPTPASALIHAATMVAAGVLVLARMMPVFEQAPQVMTAMLVVGCVTALMAALLAAVQHDIKKVLAYSTISQLGLMVAALGAGSVTAALFHLTTHAFFKSLLFLGAGVIIHAVHTQDMREMGGLRRYMPVTSMTFGIGALALAGVPPLSGFFSKDEIIATMIHGDHWVAFAAVVLTSLLTAFYVARLWFRVFAGPEKSDHIHEGEPAMVGPTVVLAVIAAVIGAGSVKFSGLLGHEGEWPSVGLVALSLAIAGTGFALGWWVYGRKTKVDTDALKVRFSRAYGVLSQKFYFDLTYDKVFVAGFFWLSEALARFDKSVIDGVVNGVSAGYARVSGLIGKFDDGVINGAVNGIATAYVGLTGLSWKFDDKAVDGVVNGLASGARRFGASLRQLQSGNLQSYQRFILGAVVLGMLAYFVIDLVLKGA